MSSKKYKDYEKSSDGHNISKNIIDLDKQLRANRETGRFTQALENEIKQLIEEDKEQSTINEKEQSSTKHEEQTRNRIFTLTDHKA